MKITNDVLRTRYLEDLKRPDVHHGRTTPKVRNFEAWKAIQSVVPENRPIIDPFKNDVWVWSDIHFGHTNIIKYTAPHRPYQSKEQMNAAMIANYLSVVKPDDVVIWGGDIGFMSESAINEILHTLPGYKIWIVGNHDLHRDGTVYKLHFDERHLCMPVDIIDEDGFEYQLHFTHYPMDTKIKGCQNVHGHIHQNIANEWNTNICVEHTGCAPKNLRELLPTIRQRIEQE